MFAGILLGNLLKEGGEKKNDAKYEEVLEKDEFDVFMERMERRNLSVNFYTWMKINI